MVGRERGKGGGGRERDGWWGEREGRVGRDSGYYVHQFACIATKVNTCVSVTWERIDR